MSIFQCLEFLKELFKKPKPRNVNWRKRTFSLVNNMCLMAAKEPKYLIDRSNFDYLLFQVFGDLYSNCKQNFGDSFIT